MNTIHRLNHPLRALLLAAIAGGVTHAAGQSRTLLDLTVSLDGINWLNAVTVDRPGITVQVRASVTYQGNGSTQIPTAFSFLTWQPTASNWATQDELLPFADRGNNLNGGAVTDQPGMPAPYGRIIPFASTGPTSSDPYRGHVQNAGGVNYLRIARTSITNWVGQGATSGTTASNNFNGAGGVANVQKSAGNVNPTVDPPFQRGITDIVIFKFALRLEPTALSRQVEIGAPTDGMSRNTASGAREASWFSGDGDNSGTIKAQVIVDGAMITVLPGPASIAMLGLAFTFVPRRRRMMRKA